MTNQHPLTDEICDGLVPFCLVSKYDYAMMRAAYDKGMEDRLNQVIEAWYQCYERFLLEEPTTNIQIIDWFEEKLNAMRPTTTQEDN